MMNRNYYETDKYVFFYGSCYSQWAMGDIEIDGTTYNCNEQYMMAEKARLFEDYDSLKQIQKAYDPAVQKACGRKVKDFDQDEWERIARDVVYKANYAKFTQHLGWQRQLLDTADKIIVEASPTDCIWGIGMSCDDPGITDPNNWRGTNWLGEAIMKVRENIRLEDARRQLSEVHNDPDFRITT